MFGCLQITPSKDSRILTSLAILGQTWPSFTDALVYPSQLARMQLKVVELQMLDVRVTRWTQIFRISSKHGCDNSFEEDFNQVLAHASSTLTETRDNAATDTNHVASPSAKDYHPGSSYSPLGDLC
jgi:hypothetical protein